MNSTDRIMNSLVAKKLDLIQESVNAVWTKGQCGFEIGMCLGMIIDRVSASPVTEAIYRAFEQDGILLELTEEKRAHRITYYPLLACSRTVWFNDHPLTMKEDILALIDRTKKRIQ